MILTNQNNEKNSSKEQVLKASIADSFAPIEKTENLSVPISEEKRDKMLNFMVTKTQYQEIKNLCAKKGVNQSLITRRFWEICLEKEKNGTLDTFF